jgi:hypothetical protein
MLTRPKRLLSLGSVLVDIRVEVPYLPERSGDVLASSSATSMTGGGFNILAAAARNGLSAALSTCRRVDKVIAGGATMPVHISPRGQPQSHRARN